METTSRIAAIALAIMLPLGIASAADTNRGGSTQSPPAGQMGHSEGSMKMHQAMTNMANMQMSGDPDQDFAQMMIHHHRHAIEMSRAQLEHGKNAVLKAQAQKIIEESQKDIAALEAAAKAK
ncbi:MAG: DUF305 domain-containing protein [Chloroflexota bacterium]|nr:DUF305 domain-containing protein [Chloroflexota bacterium]